MRSWKQSAVQRMLRTVRECQDLKQGVVDNGNGDEDELVQEHI